MVEHLLQSNGKNWLILGAMRCGRWPTGMSASLSELEGKWMVLKLLNQKDGAQQDLSEVKDEVREEIMRPKFEERFMEA